MMWNDGPWSAGDWVGMVMMMVLFWGFVIAATVLVIRSSRSERPGRGGLPAADQVLAERFARGDIDEEEFSRRRKLLRDEVTT